MLSHTQVRKILDQRYPFLLVDKILELTEKKVIGIKNITANEPYMLGHFPEEPIYPGVMLIETCSQVGGILVSKYFETRGFIAQIDGFKFLQFTTPGDQIVIEGNYVSHAGKFAKVECQATVDEKLVAKGTVTYFFQ